MISMGEGAPSAVASPTSDGAYPNDAVFNIQVPDVAAALEKVTAAGGSVVVDTASTPIRTDLRLRRQPDGSVFGLWCPPAGT